MGELGKNKKEKEKRERQREIQVISFIPVKPALLYGKSLALNLFISIL